MCIFVFSMVSLFFSVVLALEETTPGFAVMANGFAGALAGVGLVLMLYAIARQQYIGVILARTARETIQIARSEKRRASRDAEVPEGEFPTSSLDDVHVISGLGRVHDIRAKESGWVEQITSHTLTRVMPPNSVLRLETRVGAFVVAGVPLASAWPLVTPGGQAEFSRGEGRA